MQKILSLVLYIVEDLSITLKEYVDKCPVPLEIVRMPERQGLIRARLKGAMKAKAEVLVFLDAHMEDIGGPQG